ncbi:MAG: radical SAM protein [Candidatus Aminicenantes bacterium]|nr:radical SAM protein [Candidatus Aminicenantes bacterium]
MSARIPRLPLEGSLDLTYRCNNNCRHCWLRLPPGAPERSAELSFDEIRRIVDEARAMGCRRWNISGGEPLLRPDFPEIFDYLTRKAVGYTLNTNGTLITQEIARLLTRKGTKMVALYGATAEVYDAVVRRPGGFEEIMRGFAYLREAGAGFIVQLIPMKANFHQWDEMQALARSLSPHIRVGAPWLYLSCDGSPERNREIASQRLSPRDVIDLDKPNPSFGDRMRDIAAAEVCSPDPVFAAANAPVLPRASSTPADDRLFAACIAGRRDFHIDSYGRMTWCGFIKDPALRFDLRRGSFREAWDEFIPSCADKVRGGEEWRTGCGSCEKRSDCRWCAVYAYLETGRYSARIPHLCAVADEARKFKEEWQVKHRRFFQIAGITVRIESDLDLTAVRFKDELLAFAAAGPGEDNVTIRHFFELPGLAGKDLGRELYRKAPWAISRKNGTWFYLGISPRTEDASLHRVAVFSADHRHATIYSPPRDEKRIIKDGWHSLSLFPTDQIWLGPLLADRRAALVHSAAASLNGQGLVFVGHSEAGKSTTMEILKAARQERGLNAEILCDDRNVVRKWDGRNREGFDGWRVHGTWSHGTTADVSPSSAPLRAILFLEQAKTNEIVPLTDRKDIWRRLLATLIRPMVTAEWWQKELDVLEELVAEAPCFVMRFDKSGAIVEDLERLAAL